MRLRQGTFSYLPDLTDEQLAAQVRHALQQGWSLSIEHTDDPHPRNVYWHLWGLPFFDLNEPTPFLDEVRACRAANSDAYIRVNAFDARLGRQTTALSFLVNRPAREPALRLIRQVGPGGSARYTLDTVAAQ
jgi:ribulose-bisphosphate carboxylase small chain